MPWTLITGMSAVGKSSTLCALAAAGHRAEDLDTDEWSQLVPDDSDYADPGAGRPMDWRWREDAVHALLSTHVDGAAFVAGTSTHQARLYPLLDHVVLLTIPRGTATQRLAERSTNDYGKESAELHRELRLRTVVEPLLRRSACLEIDTSVHALPEVVAMIADHAAGLYGQRSAKHCLPD